MDLGSIHSAYQFCIELFRAEQLWEHTPLFDKLQNQIKNHEDEMKPLQEATAKLLKDNVTYHLILGRFAIFCCILHSLTL